MSEPFRCRTSRWVIGFFVSLFCFQILTFIGLMGVYSLAMEAGEQGQLNLDVIDITLDFVDKLWELRHEHPPGFHGGGYVPT